MRNMGIRKAMFVLAPFLAFYVGVLADIDPDHPQIGYTLGVAILMAIWWVTEVIPLAITSLLPVLLFPVLGIMDGGDVSSTYFNHIIFLFIGGFLVALAIQKWNLHKRIALRILQVIGVSPGRILLGFMLASALLSMWISNTATTMMMVPILLSIISKLEELNGRERVQNYAVGMLIAIAYSSSIGGISTLVGTAPNLSFVRIFEVYFPDGPSISFSDWFFFAFPISVILFVLLFVYMYFRFIRRKTGWQSVNKAQIDKSYLELGKPSFEERTMMIVFIVMALLWFFRADITIGSFNIPGWSGIFGNPEFINDGTVAIFMAVILFIIPSRSKKDERMMTWKDAEDIPWEIILLFGGGFALASGFKESGLSAWFGSQLEWLSEVHPLLIMLAVTFMITFLTELTSNTATVETFLPILAGLAVSISTNPLLFMIPATIAGSMAFMLPVATPPNAIVFGTKRLRISQMARTGFVLNLIAVIVVTLMSYFWGSTIFGIDATVSPSWMN